jgi:hypothetical protein
VSHIFQPDRLTEIFTKLKTALDIAYQSDIDETGLSKRASTWCHGTAILMSTLSLRAIPGFLKEKPDGLAEALSGTRTNTEGHSSSTSSSSSDETDNGDLFGDTPFRTPKDEEIKMAKEEIEKKENDKGKSKEKPKVEKKEELPQETSFRNEVTTKADSLIGCAMFHFEDRNMAKRFISSGLGCNGTFPKSLIGNEWIHAEENAMLYKVQDLKNSFAFLNVQCCNSCARYLKNAGVTPIWIASIKDYFYSTALFKSATPSFIGHDLTMLLDDINIWVQTNYDPKDVEWTIEMYREGKESSVPKEKHSNFQRWSNLSEVKIFRKLLDAKIQNPSSEARVKTHV